MGVEIQEEENHRKQNNLWLARDGVVVGQGPSATPGSLLEMQSMVLLQTC